MVFDLRLRLWRVAPELFEQGEESWVVGLEFLAVEGEEIVLTKERFGGFGEVFLGVGEGVGSIEASTPLRILSFDAVVAAGRFGGCVGGLDFGMIVAENLVVIGVSEFVEYEHGHSAHLLIEDSDVGELDGAGHSGVASMVAQPLCPGMVFGARTGVGVFGG